jgi:hypothetical protein
VVVLTTNQKGAIAEAAIIHEAAKLGIPVLRPTTDERYDIVLDLRGRFVRVQCKWAALQGDVVAFPCRSCRRAREGLRHRSYSSEEIDAFAAYCADLDRSFYVPMDVVRSRLAIQLRISPTRNNQRLGVNWADDFDFAATIGRAGP